MSVDEPSDESPFGEPTVTAESTHAWFAGFGKLRIAKSGHERKSAPIRSHPLRSADAVASHPRAEFDLRASHNDLAGEHAFDQRVA